MFPIYLVVGLLNIWAQRNNYGINDSNTGMDIRVRRDIHEVDTSSNYIHNRVPDTDYNKYDAENNRYIIQYNTPGFRAESLRLGSNTPNENYQYNAANRNAAKATSSKPWYSKLWSAISGQKTSTPRNEIIRPKTQANHGVSAALKKRKRIRIAACILCDIRCPAGYHKEHPFCVEDDHDYE